MIFNYIKMKFCYGEGRYFPDKEIVRLEDNDVSIMSNQR
jgi:hypothetical protein